MQQLATPCNLRTQAAPQTHAPLHSLPSPLLPPGAGNDYQKDLQFRKLNAVKDIIEIKVVRGGEVKVRAAAGRQLQAARRAVNAPAPPAASGLHLVAAAAASCGGRRPLSNLHLTLSLTRPRPSFPDHPQHRRGGGRSDAHRHGRQDHRGQRHGRRPPPGAAHGGALRLLSRRNSFQRPLGSLEQPRSDRCLQLEHGS